MELSIVVNLDMLGVTHICRFARLTAGTVGIVTVLLITIAYIPKHFRNHTTQHTL